MRVLVTATRLGRWPAAEVATLIARQWVPWAEVAVVPFGAAATGCVEAWAARHEAELSPWPGDGALGVIAHAGTTVAVDPGGGRAGADFDAQGTSERAGRAIRAALADRPRRLLVDLGSTGAMDVGMGLLHALGARGDRPLDAGPQAFAGVSRIDLGPALELVADVELVGLVPDEQRNDELLGLRGVTSRRGQGIVDPGLMLATDAALTDAAQCLEIQPEPGSGAVGGAALAVQALGGRVVGAVEHTCDEVGAGETVRQADLVVVAVESFDFHTRGGAVVAAMVDRCAAAGTPCVVLAGEVVISSRETRLLGIDVAHRVDITDDASLAASVGRVARTWRW